MSHVVPDVPPEQRAIRAKCVCPAGTVAEFTNDEVERSIPDRLETIVRKFPDRPAVEMNGHVVTYAELNGMVNRVARSVLARPGDNGEPVAILVDKGIGQIAAMLGTLKAARCFVLLDPSFPKERLTATLEDSQAGSVLTDGQNASLANDVAFRGSHVIELESIEGDPSSANLGLTISPNALAYITYTSGSTGRPKGVMQTHRSVLHNMMRRARATPLCVDDRLSLLTYATTNALTTTMCALLNGTALLPFDLRNEGVARLADWLRRERITALWISSPTFRNLCGLLADEDIFPDVRFLRLTSDTVYKRDVDFYKKHFPLDCVFVNGLSSSETGLLRSYLVIHDTEISGHEVPSGYAVEGQNIVLVDDEGQDVGFNKVGEIVVRSKYLSPGYWKRPDLTDAKYSRDPDDDEKRLYHSGDLGLMLPDGCLIHKGRKDFRVKVRGYGVEIVEVEKALLSHPGISQVVVVARPNDAGEARLIAYFTSPAGRAPAVGGLRNYLKERLPDYMIPSPLIRLDALPLTSGGKVDRRALPDPGKSRPALDTPFVEPTSSVEEQLIQIWAEVLALDRVGIHDNFFELGGHSLAAAGIIARVIKTFHVGLPMKALFESPSVAAMAEVITHSSLNEPTEDDVNRMLSGLEALSDEDSARLLANASRFIGDRHTDSRIFALQPGQSQKRIFCFPYAGGFQDEYFNFTRLARLIGPDYSFYGLRARGTDGVSQPRSCLEDMAADYAGEIQMVQPHGPYYLIGECGGSPEAYETARQLQARGEELALLVFLDARGPSSLPRYLWRRLTARLRFRIIRIKDSWAWGYFTARAGLHLREIQRLKGRKRWQYLFEKIGKTRSVLSDLRPKNSSPAQAVPMNGGANRRASRHMTRARKTRYLARSRYRPRPYEGRVTVLINEEWHGSDRRLGWARLAAGGVDFYKIPGNHNTYFTHNVEAVAERLRQCLEAEESSVP